MASVVEFDASSCPVTSVTVFLDRADVCRSIAVQLQPGDNEVVVRQLSAAIDKDSIRVEGRGRATIGEVIYQEKHRTPEEARAANETETSAAVAARQELEQEVKRLRGLIKQLEVKKARIQKQRDVLQSLASNMRPSPDGHALADANGAEAHLVAKLVKAKAVKKTSVRVEGGSGGTQEQHGTVATENLLSSNWLEGIVSFMQFYGDRTRRLDEQLQGIDEEVKTLEKELTAARKNLEKRAPKTTQENINTRRFVTVNVSSEKGGPATLLLSYVVMDARWAPQYDLRVFSKEKQLKINYFAMIAQSTGEDWEDARLFLSTAMPSIGGSPPELGTHRLYFRSFRLSSQVNPIFLSTPAGQSNPQYQGGYGGQLRLARASNVLADDGSEAWSDSDGGSDDLCMNTLSSPLPAAPPPPPLQVEGAEVKGTMTSTSFEIPRQTTIPADGTGHKVAVAIINLSPEFEYETVPRVVAHAFLKAQVKNTSPYALLAGPANVFLDNNFITKTSLSAVSPNEDFKCSLGVDPAVRVTYKPIRRFREQTGMFSKFSLLTLQQRIEIKNTRLEPVKLKLSDYVPLSVEEKIKVSLIRPDVTHKNPHLQVPHGSVFFNKQNILEYQLEVAAGQQFTMEIQYTVEFPASEQLEGL